ncbi:DUF309 domain-containing protein [Bacillus sp. REN10]|uniref:DUF309 domain-containing protein n=1 Tax=Bacillus sp. REN10 TaxID=2782541 RepID=UPI00193B24F1|nr:DUF309 domain-containing protein [Bacillus sp. REN10]
MYSYPLAYLTFLVHFHDHQDYFECHEVLEEYWKEKTDQTRDSVWVGLIQTAVVLYHHRRGNMKGALKLAVKALNTLTKQRKKLDELGIDSQVFLNNFSARLQDLQQEQPFTSFSIPLNDPELKQQYQLVKQSCFSPLIKESTDYLYHKHTLRDRSDVLAARERSLQERQQARNMSKNIIQ